MKAKFFLLAAGILLLGCSSSRDENNKLENKQHYPKEIVDDNLIQQYDNAKWLFYASNFFNDTVIETGYNPKLTNYRKLIEFDIEPLEIRKCNDTIDLYFSLKSASTTIYDLKSRNVYCRIGITSSSANPVYRLGCSQSYNIRFEKPYPFKGGIFNTIDYHDTTLARLKRYNLYPLDQQEQLFAAYLNSNKQYLSNWLKAEARKRGILK